MEFLESMQALNDEINTHFLAPVYQQHGACRRAHVARTMPLPPSQTDRLKRPGNAAMTYCVAVMLDAGMVFASDSRTNAGVDHISSYRKMHVFERPGDRVIVMLSSGNLSITQSAINLLEQTVAQSPRRRPCGTAQSMFEVADLVGDCLREVRRRDGPYLQQNNIDASATFIVGGQIRGEQQRLFHVYSEGNFIEATPETPYLPDRREQVRQADHRPRDQADTTTCSTRPSACWSRSTRPCAPTSRSACRSTSPATSATACACALKRHIDENDPYFNMIHHQWGEGLRKVFAQLPNPDWNVT